MKRATDYANDGVWGSLGAALFVHPEVQKRYNDGYEAMLEGLRYGAVVVNAPTLFPFCAPSLSWGAYPGGWVGGEG